MIEIAGGILLAVAVLLLILVALFLLPLIFRPLAAAVGLGCAMFVFSAFLSPLSGESLFASVKQVVWVLFVLAVVMAVAGAIWVAVTDERKGAGRAAPKVGSPEYLDWANRKGTFADD